MPREVFISYSQPDHDCAFQLVAQLEGQGIECWIAPRDITPAADWAAEIIDAIAAARVMVLVFSASSNQSPQVRREVERAVHKQVSILPFRIENVMPSKSLEYFLGAQHWLDAFPPPMAFHYERLCAYLQSQLGTTNFIAPSGMGKAPVVGYQWPAAELLRIERLLAAYVGPLAKHSVKTAAFRSPDAESLIGVVASELDSDRDRKKFAWQCRDGC